MASRTLVLTIFGAASIAAASGASAQGSIELGGFGNYTRFDKSIGLENSPGGGARFGLVSGAGFNTWILEGEAAYVSSSFGPIKIRYIPARARLTYALPLGNMASVLLGAGAVRNDYNDGDSTAVEWGYSGLVGMRFRLGSFMALRVDGLFDYMANPINKSVEHPRSTHRGVNVGLSFPIWSSKHVPEPRREEPRVVEPAPRQEPVVAPQAPAPVQSTPNAPDADRDGVSDDRDACSNTLAGATVDREGCPVFRDTDGDGVIDLRDACPATAPGDAVDGKGCTTAKDSDGDGVLDTADRCPNTPMGDRVDSRGCVIAAAAPPKTDTVVLFKNAERTVALRGVTFAPWTDDLTPRSQGVLDDVAQQLIDAPDVRVEVAGHTDSGGARTRNIRLSLARAEAVRAYLVMRGVAPERMVARGYGPDQPLASNATTAGRALNRRVELKKLN